MKAFLLVPALAIVAATAFAQTAPIEGVVRRIDQPAGKMTVRHGPIEKWDMPPMTMVFRVTDKALLDGLQVGDRIRFDVERGGGAMTITRIEKAS